jgi:L-lysine exporter family protein LysE/ArgO
LGQPEFAKPAAWRVLDVIIGTVMSLLAISLLVRFLRPA